MSYDISLESDLGGTERVPLDILNENYTYNVSAMFQAVLGYSISEWDGEMALTVHNDCWRILDAFKRDPDKFKAMNPVNGWGDFNGAKIFIERIYVACSRAPLAFVRIS